MHAEIILFKIDASFGSDNETAHEADWHSLNSPKPTMDMVTLIHDVIAAYIKKKRDATLTHTTIWHELRTTIATKSQRSTSTA